MTSLGGSQYTLNFTLSLDQTGPTLPQSFCMRKCRFRHNNGVQWAPLALLMPNIGHRISQ